MTPGTPKHGQEGEGRGAGSMTNMNRYVVGNERGKEWYCLYTVERSRTGDVKAFKKGSIWMAYAATWGTYDVWASADYKGLGDI